ncbi:MAG TPA: PASTA domain-containing protein [Gaiellaceae bacterium]|nr:PASTA domain-containing protein [Gaiellaceae bacterium]
MLLPRATADRLDDRAGLQVHLIYALPSDGVDRAFDTDGSIQNSADAYQRWLYGQTGGRALRLDTFQGSVDVTFVRLQLTDAQIAARGDLALEAIDPELSAAGFNAPGKVYAVYYDGSNPVVCGNAKWPPDWPGKTAAFYLRGTPPGSVPCFFYGFPPPGGQPNYTTFALFHDTTHTMGIVGRCAPHHYAANPGHVSDSSSDLMYAGLQPWYASVLDVGRDDYYEAHIQGCPDLSTIGFLTSDVDFSLSVAKEGNGSGTVKSALWPLIDCGAACSAPYSRGTLVTLGAEPEGDSSFAGWGGACSGTQTCVVSIDGAKTVSARFDAPYPPAPPRTCRVPRVVGRSLGVARSAIRKAGCTVGRIRRARSVRVRGRVLRQSPRAGARVRRGTRVNLTVSRGRR